MELNKWNVIWSCDRPDEEAEAIARKLYRELDAIYGMRVSWPISRNIDGEEHFIVIKPIEVAEVLVIERIVRKHTRRKTMLVLAQRRPSDRTEIVSTLGEDDSPEFFKSYREGRGAITKPTDDFRWDNNEYVIDIYDDWQGWLEKHGHECNPPVIFWTVC